MPLSNPLDPLIRFATKTITFTGAAGAGAVGTVTVFTVTGDILAAYLVPTCLTDLTDVGAGSTISLGIAGGSGSQFLAATNGTAIDAGEAWISTNPTSGNGAVPNAQKDIIVGSGNIICTVAVEAVTGGSIRFDLYWRPLSADAAVA